jgi:hypothetical protein
MDHGLPLVPIVTGVLLVYAGHFAYTFFHRFPRRATSRDPRIILNIRAGRRV